MNDKPPQLYEENLEIRAKFISNCVLVQDEPRSTEQIAVENFETSSYVFVF